MPSSSDSSSHEQDIELEDLLQDEAEEDLISTPDAPLAMTPPSPSISGMPQQPKWLTQSHHHRLWYRRWIQRVSSYTVHLIRPRLTWRYTLCSILALYVVYCWIIGSPLLASNLPGYTGPHGVGAIDLEIPLPDGPKRVSDAVFASSEDPAFDVETLLMTLYYPTDPAFHSPKSRYYWIPKPVSLTSKGFAKLAHLDNFITRPLLTFALWGIAGGITIPAEVDAPLLNSSSTEHPDEKLDAFPVTVFSHGMASSRTDYTNFLGELASRGHIVAAIEHRDGSSPGSLIKLTPKDPGRRRVHFRASELKDDMESDEDFKRAQLAFRDAEILAAVDFLTSLNEDPAFPLNNTRDPVTTLSSWPGRLDLSLLSIGGHSYGATGALQALYTVAPHASSGIILDPGKSSGKLNPNATCPIMVIHSNSWSKSRSIFYGRPHFDTVKDLVRNMTSPSWFLTSIGTSHPSVTDAPLMEPLLLSWTTGSDMDPKGALKEYVNTAFDFLTYVATGKVKGLLAEKVTHEEYGEWVSDERKHDFPKEFGKHWEIHVRPDLDNK